MPKNLLMPTLQAWPDEKITLCALQPCGTCRARQTLVLTVSLTEWQQLEAMYEQQGSNVHHTGCPGSCAATRSSRSSYPKPCASNPAPAVWKCAVPQEYAAAEHAPCTGV